MYGQDAGDKGGKLRPSNLKNATAMVIFCISRTSYEASRLRRKSWARIQAIDCLHGASWWVSERNRDINPVLKQRHGRELRWGIRVAREAIPLVLNNKD
jgi:hypothetical protein